MQPGLSRLVEGGVGPGPALNSAKQGFVLCLFVCLFDQSPEEGVSVNKHATQGLSWGFVLGSEG